MLFICNSHPNEVQFVPHFAPQNVTFCHKFFISRAKVLSMEKIILVDAWNTFVTAEGIFEEMKLMLDGFDNKKIILTNANEEEQEKFGMKDLPYPLFTLAHNPNKTDAEYYKKMLNHFSLSPEKVVYFEHNENAVISARSIGITTFHYNKETRNLEDVRKFLRENL